MAPSNSRRYYLHFKLKPHVKIEAVKRQVNINPHEIEKLDDKLKSYIFELQSYGYNIQTYIE